MSERRVAALSSIVVRASLASSGTREYRASVMLKADPLAKSEPLIRRVHADVGYRVGDAPEDEDVGSATFERAPHRRSSVDSRRGAVAVWLIGIARRRIADAAVARTTSLHDVAESAAPGEPEGDAVGWTELAAAIATLDKRQPCAADTANAPAETGGSRDEDEWRSGGRVV